MKPTKKGLRKVMITGNNTNKKSCGKNRSF